MTNPTLLRQLSNGNWAPTTAVSLASLVGRTYRTRTGWGAVESVEDAADRLARGFVIRTGSDWYDNVKRTETPEERAALRALADRPLRPVANDRDDVCGYRYDNA